MAHRLTGRYRPAWRALVGALEATLVAFTFAACSGGGKDATGPDPVPPEGPFPAPQPTPDPGPLPQPGPAPQPDPQPPAGVAGTYVLTQINNSQPGQMVSVANPDGVLIGLYRFDAVTELTLDPLQTFTLTLRYRDDKGEYGYDDHGEFKQAGQAGTTLALVFSSEDYGDEFSGIAVDGTVAIQYDFDGDGRTDTTFAFQRIN